MSSESARPAARTKWGAILAALAILVVVSLTAVVLTRWSDDDFRKACTAAADEEDWEQLRQVAGQWVERGSQPDEALTFLAEAEYQSGSLEDAVTHLLAIPASSERAYNALIAACDLQFGELNRPLDGVETLKRMIRQKPGSITTRRRLIFFYAVTLQRRAMLDAIHDAIRAQAEPPDAYAYLVLAEELSFSNGFTKNSEWLGSDPDSELFQVARTIQLLDSVSASDSASTRASLPQYLEVFQELREKFPANPELIHFELASAIREFDVDRVRSLLAQAEDGSKHYLILKSRGWLAAQDEDFVAAEAHYLASIAEFSMDWTTWHQLASCRRRLGKLDEAVAAEQIARVGKDIQKEILQQENTAAISVETLAKIASYAASCGDELVARAILIRLNSGQAPL
ncbi:MAG: hypothetical protein NXI04_13245 [Planctomycetaceae bacterium]|nr:hypothetical protein [Planctomycetaceae bacterium]